MKFRYVPKNEIEKFFGFHGDFRGVFGCGNRDMFSPNPNGPKINGRSFDPSVHKIPSIASCHDLRAMVPQIFLDLS